MKDDPHDTEKVKLIANAHIAELKTDFDNMGVIE